NFNTTWKLSDFKKIKKIGRGRFGSVSSYQEIRTQRNVAIKQCEYETEEEKAKFHREIEVMNDIIRIIRQSANQQQFIHVIEPLGFFVDEVEEKAYLVMELCSGGNLRNYIQNMKKSGTQIGIKKSWEFVSQIISAVNQIHVNEIIHGNLKPEKVLFTQDFNVKLADFTLPRNLQQGTTRVIQTKAADIWAIGVALYELLAQHHPFVGNYDQSTDIAKHDVVHRIVDEEALELPAHYPDSLKKLINAMLQKDPSRRISAEEILSIPEIAANLGGQ
ncbi:MAG: putative NEK protein kinase, partial [Streblomastix strix]